MKPRGRWNRVLSRSRELIPFFYSARRGQRFQPDRRSGIRIFTLKNAAWLALALTVLFVLFSAYMERRSRGESTFGRLYDRRIEATQTVSPPAP